MTSKKWSLILVILVLCILSLSSKALSRNIAHASEPYAYEMSLNKRLLGHKPHDSPCGSSKSKQADQAVSEPDNDNPRCHNW
ncbi:hypothetical protein P8452_61246 [Trifolium repens]|nr:hypothetical protein P8452_61246 [Trifolium repens]